MYLNTMCLLLPNSVMYGLTLPSNQSDYRISRANTNELTFLA